MSRHLRIGALLLLPIALYLTVGFRHLGVVPPAHEDEPWQASVGWKLAHDGVLASDLFSGFHGMERRSIAIPPVHPVLLAAVFRTAGVGLVQARLETVLLGLAVLLLTGVLAARLFDLAAGAAAMAVLLLVPWIPIEPYRITGIPLLDHARLARYDMGAAAFGLAALVVFLSATRRRSVWRHALTGVLVAAAGLCQLHGFLVLPVLIALGLSNATPYRRLAALFGGVAIATLPYLLYVAIDLPTFLAQTYHYADRFHLLDPTWYGANLRAEPQRYGLGPWRALAQPGPIAFLAGLPACLATLSWRAWRRDDPSARFVALPALMLSGLLALLITVKQPGYLMITVPLAAIALGWGITSSWRAAAGRRLGWMARALIAGATAIVLADGMGAVAALEQRSRSTTPYKQLVTRLRTELPANGLILAPHRLWFGLEDRDVRSWWVTFALADARYSNPTVEPTVSLAAVGPGLVVVVDDHVRTALRNRPAVGAAFLELVERQGLVELVELRDPTYGRIEVYRRRR